MRLLDDLQEQVAWRTAARPGLAFAGQLDVRAVLDAGWDPDLDRASRPDPAVGVAFGARLADDSAESAASRAWPGGHHLPDERPGDLAHLTAPVTHVAGHWVGAGRGALTRAGRAYDSGINDQLPGRAECALGQVQIDPDGRVAAAPGAAARTAGRRGAAAEEGVHQVAEREPGGAEPAGRSAGPGERSAPRSYICRF